MSKKRCVYCGRKVAPIDENFDLPLGVLEYTSDHAIPRSRINSWRVTDKKLFTINRVSSCRPCNAMKDNMTLHEFLLFLRELVGVNPAPIHQDRLVRVRSLRDSKLSQVWHVDDEGKPIPLAHCSDNMLEW